MTTKKTKAVPQQKSPLNRNTKVLPKVISKKANSKFFTLTVWEIGSSIFALLILFVFLFASMYGLGIVPSEATTQIIPSKLSINRPEVKSEIVEQVEALDGTLVNKSGAHYPVVAMIDNHSSAQPQSGIQGASLVYECLAEGGITRLMAFFDKVKQEKIGPIRSARPYFLMWVDELDAVYMHAGGSPEALQKIRELGIKDVSAGKYYWRDTARPAPHNLYTKSDLMLLLLKNNNWQDAPQTFERWKFSDTPTAGSLNTQSVDLFFSGQAKGSHVRLVYSPQEKAYARFQAEEPFIDAATSKQLSATTVIIQEIPAIVDIGDKGRLTLDVLGEGKAHILFEGKRIEGVWKKPDSVTRTFFYDEKGDEIVFPRGNIFVEVIPKDRTITFE